MLNPREHAFLDRQRVARLATADVQGAPHVIPVCFVLDGTALYITIDEKPKRPGADLKRISNIRENPNVALVADHYDEDWTQLGWLMLRGKAEILEPSGATAAEHGKAQALLKSRYPQYARMNLASLPVIAIRLSRITTWGKLDAS